MNERIMHVLEFDKILIQLKKHAATSIGKERCAYLKPSSDIGDVEHLQSETDEAMQVERLNKTIPLGGIVDIRASLKRTEIAGVLSPSECLEIANTLYGSRQVHTFINNLEDPLPLLHELGDRIVVLKALEQDILSCIDEQGRMLDSASSKLKGLRSSIRTFEARVREKLDGYTKSKSNMLSEAIITIRNDRYVLPVKHEHRQAFGGIVHDQSASGQTLFMEPKTLIDLNNQLHETRLKEKEEIERILRDLSEKVGANSTVIFENITVLAEVDFIFARAKLGMQMKASMPELNDSGVIDMKQARHPLIPDDQVVANDIQIGEEFTAIVITGPNTGGKTVALKLIGLCTLMAQSGLQIPALDGCKLAVFQDVHADIGDEQSIEQNLSTFSSHMTNIIDIIPRVNHQSLVLFDELGAGTDPQEGAALAMSILDDCIQRGARVIATTHYPELKAYGYNRESVVNASVEFDVETLQPTYRLLIGVPGRSNAFEISDRLGLSPDVIQHAKEHIGVDSSNVENMIVALEEARKKAERDFDEAHEVLIASEQLHKDIKHAWNSFVQKREQLYEKAEEKAEKALDKARSEAEEIVAELRNMHTNAGVKEHELIEARKMLEDVEPNLTANKQQADTLYEAPASGTIQVGDEIKLLTLDQTGTVADKLSEDEFLVQIGAMKVKANRKNLRLIKQTNQEKATPVTTVRTSQSTVRPELDLRGQRYEEAMIQLERYMDDVLLQNYPTVTIIHGKGTGALRNGVKEFADHHPHIRSHRPGNQNEGGSGVTVFDLKV